MTCYLPSMRQNRRVSVCHIEALFSIGRQKSSSLFGRRGSGFYEQEWRYPRNIGVYFASCPSGGFDYRKCGKQVGGVVNDVCCSVLCAVISVLVIACLPFHDSLWPAYTINYLLAVVYQ